MEHSWGPCSPVPPPLWEQLFQVVAATFSHKLCHKFIFEICTKIKAMAAKGQHTLSPNSPYDYSLLTFHRKIQLPLLFLLLYEIFRFAFGKFIRHKTKLFNLRTFIERLDCFWQWILADRILAILSIYFKYHWNLLQWWIYLLCIIWCNKIFHSFDMIFHAFYMILSRIFCQQHFIYCLFVILLYFSWN